MAQKNKTKRIEKKALTLNSSPKKKDGPNQTQSKKYTHIAADNEYCHWYGGQAQQPPPAQQRHDPQSQQDLENSADGPERLMQHNDRPVHQCQCTAIEHMGAIRHEPQHTAIIMTK